jgi:hypothetical protein
MTITDGMRHQASIEAGRQRRREVTANGDPTMQAVLASAGGGQARSGQRIRRLSWLATVGQRIGIMYDGFLLFRGRHEALLIRASWWCRRAAY